MQQQAMQRTLFVEKIGILFEQSGMPRMAGRIIGWLLICDPPSQTAAELAEALQASKGSISTMTRLLLQVGLIEKVLIAGERRDYYQVRPDVWIELVRSKLAILHEFRRLAEEGLALLSAESAAVRQRLEAMHQTYAFFERELPGLLDRWQAEQKEQLNE